MHAPAIKRPVRVKTAICRGECERALQPEQAAGGRMCAAQRRLHLNDNNTPNICNLQEAGGQEHSEHGESVCPTIKAAAESAAIFTQHLTR